MAPRSPRCEAARRQARPNNQVESRLIALLNLPIREEQYPQIDRRVRDIDALFSGLDAPAARSLIDRLDDGQDALARYFDCELHTATRDRFRALLRQRAAPVRPDRPTPTPDDDPGTDDRGVIPRPPEPRPPPPDDRPPRPPEPPPPPPPKRDPRRPDVQPPRLPTIDPSPTDILKRAQELLDRLVRNEGDESTIKRLRSLIRRGTQIAGLFAGIWAYFALRNGRLVQVLVVSDFVQQRILGRFERSGMQDEFEDILEQLLDLLSDPDLEDTRPTRRTPPDVPVRVDPRPRGAAIEDFHLDLLRNRGFESLPEFFPGIDAVRGDPTWVTRNGERIKRYVRPAAVSIKSTEVIDEAYLLDYLDKALAKMRPPFSKLHRGVEVHGLGAKAIHLVFDEGVVSTFRPDTRRTLATMARIARGESVSFNWWVHVGGRQIEGPAYLKSLRNP